MDIDVATAFTDFAQAQGATGTPVTLQWTQWTGATTVDPVTGEKSGASVVGRLTVQAVSVYFVQPGQGRVRQFSELMAGDAIVDFPASAPIDGKDGLIFIINGQEWVQAKVPDKISTTWDAIVAGVPTCRTVALTLKV